jgi:hypothetical protein
MKLRLIFLILLILSSYSVFGETKFGLVLSGQGKSALELKRITGFLNSLDSDLRPGVRFGVDRLINIKFQKTTNIVELKGEELIFDEKILPLIFSYQTRDKTNGISVRQRILKVLERELLKLPGSDNLERSYTKREVKDIDHCYLKRKGGNKGKNIRNFRFSPSMKKRCKELDTLKERRRKLEWYTYKVDSMLYKTKMEFDATSLTDQSLKKFNICKRNYKPTKITSKGKRIKALAMAIVYMAPGYTTSVAGHVAERYIYCLEDKLMDIMFEYTQMTTGELDNMRSVYKKHLNKVDSTYIQRQEGRIYMKLRTNPATTTAEGYGFYQFHTNRDIIEVWPKMNEAEVYEGLQESLKNYKQQGIDFSEKKDFEDYSLLSNNCTHPIRERLNHLGGEYEINDTTGFNPIWIFGFLKKKTAQKVIIYPSQRTLRKMKMLEKGQSIFWENASFWSKASNGSEGLAGSNMILYPETHGLLKSIIYRPTAAAVNLTSAVIETLYGVLTTPLKWLSNIPGFKWLSPKRDHLGMGIKGISLSLVELTGFRMRYPKPSAWTQAEEEYLFGELPHTEPKILDLLLKRIQE